MVPKLTLPLLILFSHHPSWDCLGHFRHHCCCCRHCHHHCCCCRHQITVVIKVVIVVAVAVVVVVVVIVVVVVVIVVVVIVMWSSKLSSTSSLLSSSLQKKTDKVMPKKIAKFLPSWEEKDFSETKYFVLNYSFHFGSFFFLLRKEVGDNNKKYLQQGNFFPSFN